ncbi:MAG: ribbon-helix-helix domain-containing protein [Dehalococcoidia bacterium]
MDVPKPVLTFHQHASYNSSVKKGDARITVSIPSSIHQRLTAIAEQSGVSISWVVRYAIDEFLYGNDDSTQMVLPLVRERRGVREYKADVSGEGRAR